MNHGKWITEILGFDKHAMNNEIDKGVIGPRIDIIPRRIRLQLRQINGM